MPITTIGAFLVFVYFFRGVSTVKTMLNWIEDVTLLKHLFLCLRISFLGCVGVSLMLSLILRQIRQFLRSTAKQQKSISRGNINKNRIGKEENDWMFSSDVSVALIHPDMRDMLPLGRQLLLPGPVEDLVNGERAQDRA